MSKILLTGMTAPQVSEKANSRSRSYAGMMYQTLVAAGHEVNWSEPDLHATTATFDIYDSVVVGIAPITSLGASRVYGALNVITALYGNPKLHLFIDAPEPQQILHSLSSVAVRPDSLVRTFHSHRRGYYEATRPYIRDRLMYGVRSLLAKEWPTTLYPVLPWMDQTPPSGLPKGAARALRGLNLDSIFSEPAPDADKFGGMGTMWYIDNLRTRWSTQTIDTTVNLVMPMKQHHYSTDSEVTAKLKFAGGALISPQRNGTTWWTPRYTQALDLFVPVATQWRDSKSLGAAWELLPTEIEVMSAQEKNILAQAQRDAYQTALLPPDQATAALETHLGLTPTQKGTP
jgi:hypothetical protein